MSLRESLRDDLADLDALQFVASAFADQSLKAIARVRATFERSAPFYQSVHDLYALIRIRAEREGSVVRASHGGSGMAALALTSNHRFYGELNLAVVRALIERELPDGARTIVIGRVGALYMKEFGYARRIHSFLFAEDIPRASELAALLSRLEAYERVVLYYPAFINLVTQRIETIEIGAAQREGTRRGGTGTHALELSGRGESALAAASASAYIFEPELALLARFFEIEVRRFLFQRVFLEAELARTAARLVAMSTAERTIGARMQSIRGALRRVTGALESMRTLEAFANIIEWRRIREKEEAPAREGGMR
ncbi:MAG: F0F1 ATP synthase subunit gamma [bacterium]|nr:F0F1 ATP synthase subunit gamma [bacterium]MDZ4284872.1 F0F1 ATP synthase subunit gamma [Patescibacteria group bacterium]